MNFLAFKAFPVSSKKIKLPTVDTKPGIELGRIQLSVRKSGAQKEHVELAETPIRPGLLTFRSADDEARLLL